MTEWTYILRVLLGAGLSAAIGGVVETQIRL